MGYEIERFVNLSPEIAETFKCSVCLDIYQVPFELPCGHIFCADCIKSCFDGSNTCECPECRKRVQNQEIKPPNRKLLCLLHSLNIKCEFADGGCNTVVKVENLIAHTKECRFKTSSRPSAPTEEPNYGNIESLTAILSESDLMDRFERLQLLQMILNDFLREAERNEEHDESSQVSSNDNALLLQDDTSCEWRCILTVICGLIFNGFLFAPPVAAIVISSLKLNSCTQIPTLPRALLALGISMLLSVILELVRISCFEEKFCLGLKLIQSFAFGAFIYVAVVVYSNLGTIKTPYNNSTFTCDCDGLLFDFSFWFVSVILTLICIVTVSYILYATVARIYNNVRATWSEWERSYVLLSFIYIIPFSGIVISVSAVTMGSVYFDLCPGIPSLTTKLIVFGTIGFVCWLIMLLRRNIRNFCNFTILVIGLIASFICVAVAVHDNFPWEFTSRASLQNINCNTAIYTYSFAIVCTNYVIIGSIIFMYFIYGGVCTCLFFR